MNPFTKSNNKIIPSFTGHTSVTKNILGGFKLASVFIIIVVVAIIEALV